MRQISILRPKLTGQSFERPAPKRKPRSSTRVRQEIRNLVFLTVGTIIAALGFSLFQVPHNLAAGGLTGISIFINYFTGWPIGIMILTLNIPLFVLGYFYLGRWPFVLRTALAVFIFSVATDLFIIYLPTLTPEYPLTDDVLLSAVYAGLVGGIGGGLVYRSGSTIGGTGIIGRILQYKTGVPLSQIYLYTDGGIVLTAGAIFGWEVALYALLTLFLAGIASDYTLEGPSSVRTATIITNRGEAVAHALMEGLGRGASQWQITGSYTGESRTMLTCTIYRPQVNDLKRVIAEVDPQAFVTIGVAHQALGAGFTRLKE